MSMKAPYREPLTTIEPGPRVVPEPRRRGEEGGGECGVCTGFAADAVWSDEHFSLHPPRTCSLPGTLWLASREHVDSFSDLSPGASAALGPLLARVETAMLAVPDVARVHVYRWGDGGAHFHVWFIARPARLPQLKGSFVAIWDDVLPPLPDELWRANLDTVAAALRAG